MVAGLAAARAIKWDLDSLIQELMMALVGYTGDIFVDSSDQDPRYQQLRRAGQLELLLHRLSCCCTGMLVQMQVISSSV